MTYLIKKKQNIRSNTKDNYRGAGLNSESGLYFEWSLHRYFTAYINVKLALCTINQQK